MKKKIKIILACLLSTSCLSAVSPVNFSLVTTKAYAETATYSLADNGEFKSLDVQSTDGQSLDLCDNYGGHIKSLTDDNHYYVLLDGKNDGVKILGEVEGKDYVAKVFESDRKIATPHDLGENISLQDGQSTLYIRTFTSEDALKSAVDDGDVTNCSKTYEVNINKSPSDGADDVGLDTLTLDSGEVPIKFDRDTLSYNISVNSDQEDVEIKATPEDQKYSIRIDGFTADEHNKYKKDVHLQHGLNEIKIVVTDLDYRIRSYTLKVTRGDITNGNVSTGVGTTQTNSSSSDLKINQWIQVNGAWKYNDATGSPIKNNWFYDRNYGKNYYLQADGNMSTGWLNNNGKWYYLGNDGAMKIGWQLINGTWYYLDSQGVMAYNTKINGYKLDANGSWVK